MKLPPLSPVSIRKGNKIFVRTIETRSLNIAGQTVILAALFGARVYNERRASKAATYVAKHGANRACFSADEIAQETYLAWRRKPTLSIQWLVKRICRKLLRREGKRLSYSCAANSAHTPDHEGGYANSALDGREDTPLPKFKGQSENELQGSASFWNDKASPTMRDNAAIAVASAKVKLLPSGQERIDAKIDLGEDWKLAELLEQGYTQTECAERLGVSQGTISNRTKKLASYFA